MDHNYQGNICQTHQIHNTPFNPNQDVNFQLLLFKSTLEIDITLNGLINLIQRMKIEKTFPNRLTQAQIFSSFLLGGLNNNYYHSRVISIISILSDWVRELKYELKKSSYTKERLSEIERLISTILSICQHCPLTISELKSTQIGKSINKLAKNLPESSYIKSGCKDIVAKWRKMADEPSSSATTSLLSASLPISNIGGNGYDNICLGKKTSRTNDETAFEKVSLIKDNAIKSLNEERDFQYYNPVINTTSKKSCSKKSTVKQVNKKQVKFADEALMRQTKIFKLTDEPNAPGVSNEEYMKIQQELKLNPNKYKKMKQDMRKEDIKMDKPVKAKEPMITWKPLQSKSISIITIGLSGAINKQKSNSIQSKEIEIYCSHILSAVYFKSIPFNPKEGKCVLFRYEDESIPKIENSKEVSFAIKCTSQSILPSSNNPMIELFNYIESFNDKELKLEDIQEIYNRLEVIVDVSKEKKENLIKVLCAKLSPTVISEFCNEIMNKQAVNNAYQSFTSQDKNNRKMTYSNYLIANSILNSSSNNNNTTNESYNSNDSIDNQEKHININDINIVVNDKFKNMFNDIRQNNSNNSNIKERINYHQIHQVIQPPLQYSVIQSILTQQHQQQQQQMQPFLFYPINSINNFIQPIEDINFNKPK